jgi:hypothetical protein
MNAKFWKYWAIIAACRKTVSSASSFITYVDWCLLTCL